MFTDDRFQIFNTNCLFYSILGKNMFTQIIGCLHCIILMANNKKIVKNKYFKVHLKSRKKNKKITHEENMKSFECYFRIMLE